MRELSGVVADARFPGAALPLKPVARKLVSLLVGLLLAPITILLTSPMAAGQTLALQAPALERADDKPRESTDFGQHEGGAEPAFDDEGWPPRERFSVGILLGVSGGGTPVGIIEEPASIATFEQGSGVLWGLRGSYAVARRLQIDLESGASELGLKVIRTDARGVDRTEARFSDLHLRYLTASIRVDLTETRLVPFITAGLAAVFADSDNDSVGGSAVGVTFGVGMQFAIRGPFFARVDFHGMRSGLDLVGKEDSRTANQVGWALGTGVRF